MPRILTTNALITCPHGGIGTTIPAWPYASIAGGIALREGDIGTLACVFPTPCLGYRLVSMHLNATLLNGAPAILETDFNQTFTGLPLQMRDFHVLSDMTRPGLPPPGPDSPPITPAMLDLAPPVVVAAPAAATFSMTAPAPVLFTFTLSSPFPLQWNLIRASEPVGGSEDLTDGNPTGAIVTPTGGQWSTPALTIALSLTQTYIAALGIGKHHFYLTGVSQRGISHAAEAILTVSA
jgi:hypothetical protein